MPARKPAFEDLTARARIREAALSQFAEHGYARATIRGIAAAAGVSAGLVRHHFGSKEALRDAVDAHVIAEIQRVGDEVYQGTQRGDLGPATLSRFDLLPLREYLVRALIDGSPAMATIFDRMVDLTVPWIEAADAARDDPPMADARTRAALATAAALGVPLLQDHMSRSLGVDLASPAGIRLLSLGMLDLYSHALISVELATSARAGVEAGFAASLGSVAPPPRQKAQKERKR